MNKAVTNLKPDSEVTPDPLALLRRPFPPNQISRLPKPTKQQTEAVKADYKKGIRCKECGSWHHPDVVHLDYVGHAALTDRLLDVDLAWFWEPAALRDGLPAFDATGGLWIKLTVCGVTRLGYGHAAAKPGVDPGAREKEVIGDALRNAAMRFGAALDLWHKGDLHAHEEAEAEPAGEKGEDDSPDASAVNFAAAQAAKLSIEMCQDLAQLKKWKADNGGQLSAFPTEVADEIVRAFNARYAELKPPTQPAQQRQQPQRQAVLAENDLGIGDDQIPF